MPQVHNPYARDVEPDHTGASGRAWLAPLSEGHGPHAQVALWLLCSPAAHPLWSWYAVSCCHLRQVEELPAPVLHFPKATHELLVFAVHPEVPLDPRKPHEWSPALMEPPNVVAQVELTCDADGARLTEALVKAFCVGHLSPDSDFFQRNFDAINATAAHFRAGVHPVS